MEAEGGCGTNEQFNRESTPRVVDEIPLSVVDLPGLTKKWGFHRVLDGGMNPQAHWSVFLK